MKSEQSTSFIKKHEPKRELLIELVVRVRAFTKNKSKKFCFAGVVYTLLVYQYNYWFIKMKSKTCETVKKIFSFCFLFQKNSHNILEIICTLQIVIFGYGKFKNK